MVEDSPAAGVRSLDELEILVIVDNETDTLSSIDAGVPQIPEAVDAAARMPPSRSFEGFECTEAFDQLCSACHGLSVLMTGRQDGQERVLLFDVGPYPELWLENARRLGVDLSNIETIFLSHWHFDHSGALPEVISAISEARSAAGLPPPVVDLHPDRPDQRGMLAPPGRRDIGGGRDHRAAPRSLQWASKHRGSSGEPYHTGRVICAMSRL